MMSDASDDDNDTTQWDPVDSTYHECCRGIGGHAQDCPTPAIERWQELANREIEIHHDGDAERLMPFPRPPWADPDCDLIGANLARCAYASDFVNVPLAYSNGHIFEDSDDFQPASMCVRAKLCGDGVHMVGLSKLSKVNDKWTRTDGVGLTPAEATELARVLLAAVEMIGGAER